MEYDIEETKERIEKLKRSEARRKRREAATAKGFTRVEDYDVWLVLEDLRTRTLRAERDRNPTKATGTEWVDITPDLSAFHGAIRNAELRNGYFFGR